MGVGVIREVVNSPMSRHRVTVEHYAPTSHRGTCTCGWRGRWHYVDYEHSTATSRAADDAHAHQDTR